MSTYYSAHTRGFYDTLVHASLFIEQAGNATMIPDPNGPIADAVAVTDDEYRSLLAAQTAGDFITADGSGRPIAVVPTPPTLGQSKASHCAQIDAAADAAYIAIGGPSPGRLAEYQQANSDATAYKAAGYAGAVPQTVQCWATSSGMTAQAAADSILTTAAQWMAVLNGVRSARLLGKGAVNAAATVADAEAAAATAIANVTAAAGGA